MLPDSLDPSQNVSAGKLEGRYCPFSGLIGSRTGTDQLQEGREAVCLRVESLLFILPLGLGLRETAQPVLLLDSFFCRWPEGGQLPGSSICAAPLGLLAAFCLPLQA